MKFTTDEINQLPEDLRLELISNGGVKVDLESSEFNEQYTSMDGVTYNVNDTNRDEVERIKESDILKSQKNLTSNTKSLSNTLTAMMSTASNSVQDGPFSAFHALMYNGKTTNAQEFMYTYVTYFSMSETIFPSAVDKVGTVWETKATRTGASGRFYYSSTQNSPLSIDVSSVYGSSASYPVVPTTTKSYMENNIRIPVSYVGTTTTFASGYAHPYTVLIPTVYFGPNLSINFSGTLQSTWSWSSSFVIGNTSMIQ